MNDSCSTNDSSCNDIPITLAHKVTLFNASKLKQYTYTNVPMLSQCTYAQPMHVGSVNERSLSQRT